MSKRQKSVTDVFRPAL